MPALPQITTTAPTVTPAVVSKTYDKWWLANCSIIATDPSNVKGILTYKKYRDTGDATVNGGVEFSPTDQPVIVEVDNIMNSTDANILNAMGAVMVAAVAIAAANGLNAK